MTKWFFQCMLLQQTVLLHCLLSLFERPLLKELIIIDCWDEANRCGRTVDIFQRLLTYSYLNSFTFNKDNVLISNCAQKQSNFEKIGK